MSIRRVTTLLVPLVLLIPLATLTPAGASTPSDGPAANAGAWDIGAARALVDRVLPRRQARQIELAQLNNVQEHVNNVQEHLNGVQERFRIGGRRGHVEIAGTGPSALLAGVNAYLDRVARVDVSWNGDSLDRLPDTLPAPQREILQDAAVSNRFALNDTDDGYTGAYRTWQDWEHELDVLALHGINRAFLPVGTEAVYLETFKQFGYSEDELLKWIPQPSHQPWWLLQNMCCFPSAISKRLVDQRAALGRRIADRMRSLGITPVLPGYFGTVPPGFADKLPGARTVPQGGWVGFQRPDWLDPTGPAYAEVAKAFYASSARILGTSTHYKMDLLHEGGTPGPVPVGAASLAVQQALETARPGATWVFLGWQNNPRPDTLAAIDRSKVLIVDGLSDRYQGTNRNADWPDTAYAFGSIWNFGGHTTMGANTGVWEDRFWSWRSEPGSTLDGIAVMPEASDNNPAAFDYLTGLAWRSGPVSPQAWFADWAARRYGGSSSGASTAWAVLGRTAYAMPADGSTEAQDGLYAADPSLTATSGGTWSPGSMRYDATEFGAALPALLAVDPRLRGSSAYRYDLTDVTRQVLSNRSRTLLPRLKTAYDARDAAAFDRLAALWLRQLQLLDQVTGTNRQTMLGPWLASARSWGSSAAESDALEQSARTLVTVWGTRQGYDEGLADYANREWSGLIGTYYLPRWEAFLTELSTALREGREPVAFDWYQRGADWAARTDSLPKAPSGSVYDVAQRVLSFLKENPEPVSVTAAPVSVADGASVEVPVRLRNPDPFRTASGVRVTLTADPGSGLTVGTPSAPVTSLAPGAEAVVKFPVTASGTADGFYGQLTASASASTAGSSVVVKVLRTAPVQPPYLTRSTNAAVFAQRGSRFLVEGAGDDLWGGTKQFGSIYRPGVLVAGASVTTRVDSQDRTGPWARAGLIVSTDLAGTNGRGFANIAVSPDHGCLFSYDSNNDGTLDRYGQVDGLHTPLWVRLSRTGDTVTGSCSTDGTAWTPAGSFTVPAGAVLDAGLFMSAANGGTGTRGAAEFTGFEVTP